MRSIVVGFVLSVVSVLAHGATGEALWRDVEASRLVQTGPRFVEPTRARTLALDYAAMSELLKAAPAEREVPAAASPFELMLPHPEGGYARFRVVESPIMEPALAARYPMLKTYLGQGIDDPAATVRFDLTPLGFRAQWISWDRTIYIEPYQRADIAHYVVFDKDDLARTEPAMRCEVTGDEIKQLPNFQQRGLVPKVSSGTSLRTYRLAVAATGEYTGVYGGTVVDGLGGIVTTMNRVNGIYEREVAVRMVLVANNDQIIYTNSATDPYTNNNGSTMLGENQTNLTSVIGGANYDVGHVFSTGGGGVASLGSVCVSTRKAQGVTGSGNPRGDAFDVDYVAHELGHQFNGPHTFNSTAGSCSGNRTAAAAYEVGSGVTIMAYAGICGIENTQPNSEDYFHRRSLNDVLAFTTTGGGSTCGTTAATGNTPPTVTAPADVTIPRGTPFQLTATGSDSNGDTLTYVWEQFDAGASTSTGVPSDTTTNPLFRNYAVTNSPTRIFPALRYILDNGNAVPNSAPLPGTTTPNYLAGEFLPTTSRSLNFAVTVRDNRAGGGGTNEDAIVLSVNSAAGPFAVTAPNTAVTWAAGSSQTITWDVAGTTANGVNTANVQIALSVDGGYTFPTILAASTPNDGSETLTIPAGTPGTTRARIRVAAVGNVFFDIGNANFTITGTNSAPTLTVTGSVATTQGAPTASANVATVSDAQDAPGSLAVAVSDLPTGLVVTAVNNAGTVNLSATASCSLVAPTSGQKTYPVLLSVTDSGGASTTLPVNVLVGANPTPTLGAYGNVFVSTGGSVTSTPATAPADANGNLLATTVSPTTLPGSGATAVSVAANGVVTINPAAGTTPGTYAIRARVADTCGAVRTREFNVIVAGSTPLLSVSSAVAVGDNNRLDPNDCNAVNVTVANLGTTASAISAVLATSTPGVTVTQPNSAYADIPGGGSGVNVTPFQVSTDNTVANGSTASFTLTLNYTGGGSPTVLNFTLPVGAISNYTFTSGTGASIPAGGAQVAGSNTDDGIFTIAVPFALQVYDTAIAAGGNIRVTTNGTLQLVGTDGSTQWSNGALPSTGTGDVVGEAFPTNAPVLFPFWDDLQLNPTGGGIYLNTVGTAPNRQFVVEWRGRVIGDGAAVINLNFAAVFNEGSSGFQYRYVQTSTGVGLNGVGATVGIQRATTGPQFTQHSLNQSVITPGLVLTATLAGPQPGTGVCLAAPLVTVAPTAVAVSETGPTSANVLVSLNTAPTSNVTTTLSFDANVQVNTGAGFGASPQVLTLTPANAVAGVSVAVRAVDDAIDEASPHSSTITTSATSSSQVAFNGLAVADIDVSITDNDTAGVTITRSGGSNAVTESGTTDSYTIVLASQPTATVNLAIAFPVSDLTVNGDTDGTFNTSFTAGNWNTPQTITLAAVNDRALEGNHAGDLVHAYTSADPNYQGITATVDGAASTNTLPTAITDNETAALGWLPASGSATEGTSNATAVQLDITADPVGGTPTLEGSIAYTIGTTLVTAEPGDLGAITGALVFTNASDLATNAIGIAHADDTLVEGNETYTATITLQAPPAGVSVAPTAFAGTIVDADTATLALTGSATVGEAAGSTPLTVTLATAAGNTLESAVSVALNLVDGSATYAGGAGDYFIAGPVNTAPVNFAAGAGNGANQVVAVSIRDDVLVEGNENFSAGLGSVTGAATVTGGGAAITITDNDIATVSFEAANSVAPEAVSPHNVNAVLTITSVGNGVASLAVPVTVAITQTPGTASTPADYTLATTSISWAAATQTAATRAIATTIVDDAAAEPSETFSLGFGTVTGPATAAGSNAVTIVDNDAQATTTTITSDDPDPSVVGQPYTVAVSVAGSISAPAGNVSVSDGSASCGPVALTAAAGLTSTASCALTSTSAGAKTLVATYAPSGAFAGSSGSATHQVGAATTTIAVTGPARSRINQPATYAFALAVSAPGAGTPNGTVTVTSPGSSCNVTVPTATPSCAVTPSALGPRTISAGFAPANGNFLASSSSGAGNAQTVVFALSDIVVTKSDGGTSFVPGAQLVYTITVRNQGPDAANAIRIRDTVPAALTGVQWTCDAIGGVVCPQASGSGNIDATTGAFPVNGQLTYVLGGTVTGTPASITNTASVDLPVDTTIEDPVPGNNSATDVNLPDAVFRDGFESVAGGAAAAAGAPVGLD